MVLDIKRAFLYGDIEECIYINLPNEDPKGELGYVGKLVKAMYGTQSAPLIWQKLCRRVLESMGFVTCKTSPCCYFHKDRGVKVVTHVDDFACTGMMKDLKWLQEELEKDFELKSEVLGFGKEEMNEVKFLGRVIKCHEYGISYQADPKHVKILVDEWGLKDARSVGTPGNVEDKGMLNDDEENNAAADKRQVLYMRFDFKYLLAKPLP